MGNAAAATAAIKLRGKKQARPFGFASAKLFGSLTWKKKWSSESFSFRAPGKTDPLEFCNKSSPERASLFYN